MQLSALEARVLGSLIEKEITTPDQYPLSLNALVNACNQKTSREPVMQLSERETETALRSLEDKDLVSVDHGSRVERYENRARTVFHLRRDETALLCLLLLRGPQTPGELRGRADRLFTFDDVSAVLSALDRMARPGEEPNGRREALVAGLPRQPGAREQRFQQLVSEPAGTSSSANRGLDSLGLERDSLSSERAHSEKAAPPAEWMQKIEALEATVRDLELRLSTLEQGD